MALGASARTQRNQRIRLGASADPIKFSFGLLPWRIRSVKLTTRKSYHQRGEHTPHISCPDQNHLL